MPNGALQLFYEGPLVETQLLRDGKGRRDPRASTIFIVPNSRPTKKTCHSFQAWTPVSIPGLPEEERSVFRPRYPKNKWGIGIEPPSANLLPGSARILSPNRRDYCPFLKIPVH